MQKKEWQSHLSVGNQELEEKAGRESAMMPAASQIASASTGVLTSDLGGVFPYECKYGDGPRGYIGRMYAKNFGRDEYKGGCARYRIADQTSGIST